MNRTLSVAFYLPGLQVGGAEIHTLTLREGLDALGFRTSLIVYGRGRSEVLMHRPGARDAIFVEGTGAASLRSWRSVGAALRGCDADVIVAVNPTSIITSVAFKRQLRSRIVGIMHTTVPTAAERLRTPPFLLASRFLDKMVYVSHNQRAFWRAQGLRIADRVIHNGIDLGHYSPRPDGRRLARNHLGIDDGTFLIGIIASLRPEKNHLQLVEAIAELRRKGFPARAIFVGQGPHRGVIEAYVQALGLTEHVIFAGEQSDVRPFMQAIDVGVLCSTAVETLSLSALETLAMGTPVIMSEIGGASEIIQPGINGYLVAPGDTEELVARLEQLRDPSVQRRLAANARASAASFSLPVMMEHYVELILQQDRIAPALEAAAGT